MTTTGRHNLYDDDGRETTAPVVFRDAIRGWLRELATVDTTAPILMWDTEVIA